MSSSCISTYAEIGLRAPRLADTVVVRSALDRLELLRDEGDPIKSRTVTTNLKKITEAWWSFQHEVEPEQRESLLEGQISGWLHCQFAAVR